MESIEKIQTLLEDWFILYLYYIKYYYMMLNNNIGERKKIKFSV
jgi:hypothetical protein